MKRARITRPILILMALLLPLGALSCFDDVDELNYFLEKWVDLHDVNPTTPGGAANLAKRAASDSTGNEDADAILGAFKPLADFKKAEAFMEQGRRNRDAKAMDAAIALRPNDWSYRASRAALAFEQNDWKTAGKQMRQGDEKARQASDRERIRYRTQTIDELESSNIKTTKMSPATKEIYYTWLMEAYNSRAALTGSQEDGSMAEHYSRLMRKP